MEEHTTEEKQFRDVEKLPGPSGLPFFGNLLQIDRKRFHLQLQEWSERYGSIYQFKIVKNRFVVFSNPEIIQELLRKRPDYFRRMKSIESVFAEISAGGVFSAEGELWRRQRRLILPAFQNSNLREFFGTLITITDRLKKRWENFSISGLDLDIGKDLMRYTIDVTTYLSFKYDVNTLENEGDVLQQNVEKILPAINRRINAPIPYWRYFKMPADRALDQAIVKIRKKVDEMIQVSRGRFDGDSNVHKNPTNLLEAFLSEKDSGQQYTDDEIFGNIITILVAGEDTTANVMAWIIYFLLKDQEILKKMKDEADRILGDSEQIRNFEDLDRLPYIEAVILETMRLKSVAPFLFIEALSNLKVHNISIKKGTNVITANQVAALQEENFTSARKFYPERWLTESRPTCWNHNLKSFMPFGGGSRVCPGKNLALFEIKAVMVMLCKNFSLLEPHNGEVAAEEFDFVTSLTNLWVRLKPLKDK